VISRRFSPWQKLVALAPLLLVAVYLPGEMMMRCRFDGLLRPACCCPQAQDSEPQGSGPVVKGQDCCDRVLSTSEQPVVEAARRADPGPITWVWAATPIDSPVTHPSPPRPAAWATHRYGPARGGPPIVLVKQSFLI
jgi:hypothetical protein